MTSRPVPALCFVLLLGAGCLESNPQPSPVGGKDTSQAGGLDAADRAKADAAYMGGDAMEEPGPSDAAGEGDAVLDGELTLDIPEVDALDVGPDLELGDLNLETSDTVCKADCLDKACGNDGCSGTCGTCPQGQWCNQFACELVPDACDECRDPYPACANVDGDWYCVQCLKDSQCGGGCTCDASLYACMCGPPPGCGADSDCVSSQDKNLLCDETTGLCYDEIGICDNIEAFCNAYEGSHCFDPTVPEGYPSMPGSLGLCTCDDFISQAEAMACAPLGTCPDSECFEGTVCVKPADLLCNTILPCPTLDIDGGVCINVVWLLEQLDL